MKKRLVVKRSEGSDWYTKASNFLSENNCNPLELELAPDVDPASVFQEALASLVATTGHDFKIDPDAPVLLVTADLSMAVSPGDAKCGCQCGAQGNCGGSGSGGSHAA